MNAKKAKVNNKATSVVANQPAVSASGTDGLPPEAFLKDAENEPKRSLLLDHLATICVLRNKKRFTFRAIADWLGERGVETDHSAVYRAYLTSIPADERHPNEDWSDVDAPGFGDEGVTVRKP